MKYLILILAISSGASASEARKEISQDVNTPVPAALKGGKVTIMNKDGSSRVVSSDDFKVVPRKQQFKIRQVERVQYVEVHTEDSRPVKRNRVSLLGGVGRKAGLNSVASPAGQAILESQNGFVLGVSYQRLLTDSLSVGVQGTNNKAILGSVGMDF